MAEKRANMKQKGNLGAVGMILKPFFIYFVVYYITLVILTYLVMLIARKAGGGIEALFVEQEMTVNAILGGLAMLAGILPLFSDFRREINNSGRNCTEKKEKNNGCNEKRLSLCKLFLTGVLAFTSSITVNILFISLQLTENSESYSQVAEHQYGVFFPAGLILYGVVSPLAEEIVFRGIVYSRMKKIFSAASAVVLSALLFGLYHGNAVQGIYGFLMGMLIAYTFEKCGGFLYAFLFHAVANVSVYVITGSPVLYERIITGRNGILFAGISVLLLFILYFTDSFRGFQKLKAE